MDIHLEIWSNRKVSFKKPYAIPICTPTVVCQPASQQQQHPDKASFKGMVCWLPNGTVNRRQHTLDTAALCLIMLCWTMLYWQLARHLSCTYQWNRSQLEQLERLRYPLPHPMITHTSDSNQIPSQKKTKSKLQILIAKTSNIKILQHILHVTHLLKLFDKVYKYKMDPSRTVGATEWIWLQDGWKDRQSETNIPPQQLHCVGAIMRYIIGNEWFKYKNENDYVRSAFCC